jgi:hypothetical protein
MIDFHKKPTLNSDIFVKNRHKYFFRLYVLKFSVNFLLKSNTKSEKNSVNFDCRSINV